MQCIPHWKSYNMETYVYMGRQESILYLNDNKSLSLSLSYYLLATFNVLPIEKGGAENAKKKKNENVSKPKIFWYQNICHVLTQKMHTHT